MKKIIALLIILTSCEKQYEDLLKENTSLDLYIEELDDNWQYNSITDIYTFTFSQAQNNTYFKISYNTEPMQRVYWESTDMFYIVIHQDTTWTPVINFSTYADENGNGHQLVYVNTTLSGDTLNVVGKINGVEEELKIRVIAYDPDCYPLFCDENGNWY